jgi:DnaA family protein
LKQIALDLGLETGPSFERFFPGSNQEVLSCLEKTVAEKSPIPVYLWGPESSGKTHLLQSVQTAFNEVNQTIGWLSSEIDNLQPFHPQWSAIVMDDVHLYGPALQQHAFAWFIHATQNNTVIVSAGNAPPMNLSLRDDLRSRMGWGQIYALHPLNDNDCRIAMQKAAKTRGFDLPADVLDYLLLHFSRDLGSLMQLLDMMDKYGLETQRAITIPFINAMMQES